MALTRPLTRGGLTRPLVRSVLGGIGGGGGIVSPLELSPMAFFDASPTTLFDAVSGGNQVADGGSIALWQDQSGNGHHLTQATPGNQFKLSGDAVIGQVLTDAVMANAGITFSTRSASWFVVSDLPTLRRSRVATTNYQYGMYFFSSTDRFNLQRNGNTGRLEGYTGTGETRQPAWDIRSGVSLVGMIGSPSETKIIYNDKDQIFAAPTLNTVVGFEAGNRLTHHLALHGRIRAIIGFDRPISDEDMGKLRAWAFRKYSIPLSPSSLNLLISGDSISAGQLSTARKCWTDRLTLPVGTVINNVAESSARLITHLIPTDGAFVDSRVTSGANNVGILFAGTNDMFVDSRTAVQVKADAITWCNARKSAGVNKIGIMGMLPRGASDTQRQALRASFLADFTVPTASPLIFAAGPGITYADRYVDLGGDPTIGPFAARSNTTLYPDAIHPSDTGHAIIADYGNGLINQLA